MRVVKNGFSLVELIVAVTVILVLTGVGVTTFSGLAQSRKMITVRNELVSWLNLARNLAITGQLPDKSLGLSYIKVSIGNGNITASGMRNSSDGTTFFSQVIDPNKGIGVSVVGLGGSQSFGFSKGNGKLTNAVGNLIGQTITLVLSGGVSDSVIISDLGIINEN